MGDGLGDGTAGLLGLEVAQLDWFEAGGGQNFVVADWLALDYFAVIGSADLFGFLCAPCFRFPVVSVGCVAESLKPFLANPLC